VNLLAFWDVGPYIYQVWETEDEFLFQCIDTRTLETIAEYGGNTPLEAIYEGVREAMRHL
jgi:hypothetical protein